MSYQIEVPDNVYQYAQKIAQETAQSPSQVIIQHLLMLPNIVPFLSLDEQAELNALAFLSDDTLLTIAGEQMTKALKHQLSDLMEKNSIGTIQPNEANVLADLVARGERLMLRKAEAARILHERGHIITPQIMKPLDE
jgi:hypothetical protein